MTDFFAELFAGKPLMAILRGFDPKRTVELAEQAWELGVTAVEVPVETPEQVESLRATVAAAGGRPVGAGTVCTTDQVDTVHAAGAAFTVAPGHDPVVAAHSRRSGLPHLPGVATPTELQAALRAGHTWLKLFPAGVLGAAHIRALRGPFPNVRIVATGGIDAANARDFLSAGADVVAVGSALADPTQLPALAALLG
ncbi:MAG TPA: bifunctional 4-hydroxy-2-oxoglutarate aldolase/2-dehydro-3-deoxy-phosphogluconate aldolase [Pseudonocardiaceae bacterium]|nr:bifunctional 4-hydroxy-2-oxoglutarate aldolase/2-dehydro-3-deoxy-phosphogluconate aldolase [Pseudonocardiaceae bacterium]